MNPSSIQPELQNSTDEKPLKQRHIRKKKLPFARPDITDAEIQAVNRVLISGWLTSGPEVVEFEKEFAEFVGAEHAIAVNSATAALHLALAVRDIGPKDAVLIPAITFTATAEVVTYSGALPIILDVDRDDYLMSPAIILDFIEKACELQDGKLIQKSDGRRIRAMMPVHLGGRPCDMDALMGIAKKYDMYMIEDAAHALPAAYNGRPIGSIGEMTAFSFYATKNITTGEGGMLTTNDAALAERVRRMRLHGIQGQTYGRKRWMYDVVDQGYKYNMMDMCAAMGRVQLVRAQEMLEKRREIAKFYEESLKDVPGLRLSPPSPHSDSCHLYTIEVSKDCGISRDRLVEELYARQIATSLHFIPLYRHTFYKENYNLNQKDFPNSEEFYENILSLPIYSAMSLEDAADVVYAIRESLA